MALEMRGIPPESGNVDTYDGTESTHVLPGPVMEEQALEVQYSDTTPYIRLICSKNDIAANKHKTHRSTARIRVKLLCTSKQTFIAFKLLRYLRLK